MVKLRKQQDTNRIILQLQNYGCLCEISGSHSSEYEDDSYIPEGCHVHEDV
jgi:hypothetical protein